jgi:hypothetical protein
VLLPLAEISDKMDSVAELCLLNLALGMCAFAIAWRWRWVAILAGGLAVCWIRAMLHEFVWDTSFHNIVVGELGHGYVAWAVGASCIPAFAVLAAVIVRSSMARSKRARS